MRFQSKMINLINDDHHRKLEIQFEHTCISRFAPLQCRIRRQFSRRTWIGALRRFEFIMHTIRNMKQKSQTISYSYLRRTNFLLFSIVFLIRIVAILNQLYGLDCRGSAPLFIKRCKYLKTLMNTVFVIEISSAIFCEKSLVKIFFADKCSVSHIATH